MPQAGGKMVCGARADRQTLPSGSGRRLHGLALWLGLVKDHFFALFYLALSACCAAAGYGSPVVFRRPSASRARLVISR